MITDSFVERLKQLEGFKDKPYFDTVGKVTIGYGRNLEANPLTTNEVRALMNRVKWNSRKDAEDWAEMLMKKDLARISEELENKLGIWPMCSKSEQIVLLDMAYNVGVPSLLNFKGMLDAIDNDNLTLAAYECLNSKYATTVKTRAIANAKMLAETEGNFEAAMEMLQNNQPSIFEVLAEHT